MSVLEQLQQSYWNLDQAKLKLDETPLGLLSLFLNVQESGDDQLSMASHIIQKAQARLVTQINIYRHATAEERQQTVMALHKELALYSDREQVVASSLSERSVLEMLVVLSRNFLTYIDVLHRAEMGPAYVSTLKASGVDKPAAAIPFQFEFIGMKDTVWDSERYALLRQHFDWQFPVGLVPKTPLKAMPDAVWSLFQVAQNHHLKKIGKLGTYKLEPAVAEHGSGWGIYPRIQAFGSSDNKAVDSPQVRDGLVAVAEKFGKYRLPGGGQLEVKYQHNPAAAVLSKAFDEVLEERFAQLYRYVGEDLNQVRGRLFQRAVSNILYHESFNSVPQIHIARQQFKSMAGRDIANSALLGGLMAILDEVPKGEQTSEFHTLCASLQVETFKLTVSYAWLFAKFSHKDNVITLPILQVADMRGQASKQTAFAVMTKRHPVDIIKAKYPTMTEVAGDDMADSAGMYHVSPAQYVGRYNPDFSHDLTAWAASLIARSLGHVTDEAIQQCLAADDLVQASQAVATQLNQLVMPVVAKMAAVRSSVSAVAAVGGVGLMSPAAPQEAPSVEGDGEQIMAVRF